MNQPRLRFKEFKGEWDKTKFGNIMDSFSYGLSVTSKKYDGVHKYLRITDIDDNSRKFKVNGVVSPNANLSENENYILKKGDLVFARTGASTGKSYLYDNNDGIVYFAGFLIKAKAKKYVDRYFIFFQTFTHKYWEFIKINSMRSGQPGINIGSLKSFKFNIPNYPEQQKIGQFFQNLDQQIELQSDKLEHLKQSKQGYLQKMFANEHNKQPKLRIKLFSDNWNNKKISTLASFRNGGPFKSEHFTKTGIPIVRISNVLSSGKVGGNFAFYKENKNFDKYFISNNAILIAMSGATVGKIAMLKTNENFYQNQRVGYFKVKEITDNYFLFSFLNSNCMSKQLKKIKVSGAQPNISSNDINNFFINYPSLPEQKLIGQFFSHLDHLIDLQQQKVDHLKQLKQAYLQKMFI